MFRRNLHIMAMVVGCLAGLGPLPARADHDMFRWGYPRLGFHGEADLVRALEFLRLAYTCDDPTHAYARRAESLTLRAAATLCQPAARVAALRAVSAIRAYRQTHLPGYITVAAQHIQQALLLERTCHCGTPAPTPVHPMVVAPPVLVAPPLRPALVPATPGWPYRSGIGVWSGSHHGFWGFRISF